MTQEKKRNILRRLTLTLFVVSLLLAGYTMVQGNREIEVPNEMLLPMLSQKQSGSVTESISRNLSEARELSENFILESDSGRLESIETEFDKRMGVIASELDRLSDVDDPGLEVIVAQLMRLSVTYRNDVKTAFTKHRQDLGLDS